MTHGSDRHRPLTHTHTEDLTRMEKNNSYSGLRGNCLLLSSDNADDIPYKVASNWTELLAASDSLPLKLSMRSFNDTVSTAYFMYNGMR
jgi:hypothetical protein